MQSRRLTEGASAASIGPCYIIQFADTHVNFRLADFRAGADYLDAAYAFVSVPYQGIPWRAECSSNGNTWQDATEVSMHSEEAIVGLNVNRPFMLVHLANDDVAHQLSARVSSIKAIYQQWASGPSDEEVRRALQRKDVQDLWAASTNENTSWRATIVSHQRSVSMEDQVGKIHSLKDVIDFKGPIKLREADIEWAYLQEWTPLSLIPEEVEAQLELQAIKKEVVRGVEKGGRPQRQRLVSVHVGRKVADGKARELVSTMDVKKRRYIGNTTMESQMSLVTANMALAGPGKLVYDPFAGTCSLLLAAAALGAHVIASDIDGRPMRGRAKNGEEIGVIRSAKQYGIEHNIIDCLCGDISQHPWRSGGLFDAIVADPPYGVRAGAKQLGKREMHKMREEPFTLPNGEYSHQQSDYIPPTRPYALNDLLQDLMNISARLLAPKGRLVFWMPTMIESDDDEYGSETMQQLQLDITNDFTLIARSLQDYGSWGRWLITLEKISTADQEYDTSSFAVLPPPPTRHLQNAGKTRVRATDDPSEFRNRVSGFHLSSNAPFLIFGLLCSSSSMLA